MWICFKRTSVLGELRMRQQKSNSTSGRGARASYRTMLPEISARRSLLEASFRYLSPGSEGEKCRPLDHAWQNPFVHSARCMIGSNSYIYTTTFQLFPPCGTFKCVLRWYTFNDCGCALAETFLFMVHSHHKSCVFPYSTRWCILVQDIHVCAFAVQIKCLLSRLDFYFSGSCKDIERLSM